MNLFSIILMKMFSKTELEVLFAKLKILELIRMEMEIPNFMIMQKDQV